MENTIAFFKKNVNNLEGNEDTEGVLSGLWKDLIYISERSYDCRDNYESEEERKAFFRNRRSFWPTLPKWEYLNSWYMQLEFLSFFPKSTSSSTSLSVIGTTAVFSSPFALQSFTLI